MSARLPSGRGFLKQLIALHSQLAIPALFILVACLAALLRLTTTQWLWIAALSAGYAVVASPLTLILQQRMAHPIQVWLDAREAGGATEDQRGAAFRAFMALPPRAGVVAAFTWVLPSLVTSLGMDLLYDGWGGFQYLVVITSGCAAGFTTGTFLGFRLKSRFASVREALVEELPDPTLRARWVPSVPLRTKLFATITGVTLVPVVLAIMLSLSRTGASLEEFTLHWQARLLDALPADPSPAAIDDLNSWISRTPLPAPVQVGLLSDLSGQLDAYAVAHVREQIRGGEDRGSTGQLPTQMVFAWRKLPGGHVLVAATPAAALRGDSTRSVLIFGVLLVLSFGLAVTAAFLLAGDTSSATEVLRAEAERLASGDLRPGRVFESEDELGELARAFQRMTSSLRTTIGRVADAADRVEGSVGRLAPVSQSLGGVTADQVSGIQRAAASMEEINAQVRGIAGSSQALNESVEESSSSILELGASGEELNETAALLSSKVEEVSSSIEQMVRSVRQVVENTEGLASAAEETSASMEEMASSLREVDSSAEETARLSSHVVRSAESGQEKVRQTIEGMEAIRQATETAERVIRGLHRRTEEIGAIVDVIDDVADETNLLALNAAIIAAQAGEHGRAFSVVADEIKDLAERVLASTKEIGSLIGSVQDEAGNAIGAIEQGSASVASGVDLSAEAGMALEEITRASRSSGQRIGGIGQSLREQAKAAAHVVELMERVRGGVDEIRAASAEQDRGNVIVYQGSVTMREVAQQVRGTTEEQARGSGRIRESVEGVREAVEQINAALQEQSQACTAAVEFLEAVQVRTRANEESTLAVDSVAKDLLRHAEALREEVRRFQV